MAYYLQMDGVDDYLKTPSITFNQIILDMKSRSALNRIYLDARNGQATGYFQKTSGGTENWGASISSVKLNGVTKTNATSWMPVDTRCTVEVNFSAAAADDVNIFSGSNNLSVVEGDLYDVKFYNGATLVAWYDMTLGNVTDQSGNGNNATVMNGGTWVSSGSTINGSATLQAAGTLTASGTATGTTINGSATLQGVGTLTALGSIGAIQTGSASLQGVGSLTASGALRINGSATLQGVGTLAASGTMTITGSATLQGVGTLTASGGFPIFGSATLQGIGTLTASGVTGSQIARTISLLGALPSPIQLLGGNVASINVLQGSMPSIIALEGGIMATKTKQDFPMYQGDTPPVTFTISDVASLTGATLKWAVRKGHVKGPQVIFKDLTSGLSVSGLVVAVNLVVADTLALEGKYYHELELTDVSGRVSTVAIGEITILPSGV